jgi:aminoglycoside 3-N-acetyltransferase I
VSVAIRRLDGGDVVLMRALNALFGEAFGDAATYGANPPSDAYLTSALTKPHLHALVALEGRAVVGGLVAYELEKLESERREIYIYDLAVAEERRRIGVATRLIERLREIAVERGAWVIYVQADHGDEPAIALYTKVGEREDVMHFDIAVDAL